MSIINRSVCRGAILSCAEAKWPGKMRQVEKEVLDFLEASLLSNIHSLIRQHPTIGHRISMGTKKREGADEQAI